MKRKPAGALTAIGTARVGLYKPWTENQDEGWTRWLLEQHEFRFQTIVDADLRAGGLRRRYDAIILPSATSQELRYGNPVEGLPVEYVGGLGESGIAALRSFVESGGTLLCLDQACALPIEELKLPIRDVAREASADDFFCPGSLVTLDLDPLQPEAYGMPPHTAAFFASSSAYEVSGGAAGVQIGARYGLHDLLISGWLEGERVIAGRPAIVEVKVGAAGVVLFGFPCNIAGNPEATFRLLFNAIFTSR